MIERKAYSYWEGPRYPYINYCLKTIEKRCGVEFHLITPQNVGNYLKTGFDIHIRWNRLKNIAQKVDFLRMVLIQKYSGCWIDADTVLLKDLNPLFEQYQNDEMVGMKWTRTNRILNGYFMAQAENKFLKYCIDWINHKLTFDFRAHYIDHGGVLFGECLFGEANHNNRNFMKFMDVNTFLPFQFPFEQDRWWEKIKIEKFLKPCTVAIGLNHSQYPFEIRNKAIMDHLKHDTLFSSVFKYSESLGKIL